MTATTNIALKVPFNEKDQAKSLGARWNAESKHWYVPQGVDAAPFEKWFTNSPAPASTPTSNQSAPKPTTKTDKAAPNRPFEDNIDAINTRLRDAYEPDDGDAF